MGPDLSVVLNVHDEVGYFARTMRSTEAAAQFAAARGEQLELVIVMDRPTPAMAALVGRHQPSGFDRYRTIEVDRGSLGPARNDGIGAATGRYVALCDGDDLVSQNTFAASLATIRALGPGSVVFPEFVFAFGDSYFINHYSGCEHVTPLRFLTLNPYPSRITAPRTLLQTMPFADLPTGAGYAFEDWLLNTQMLAAGVRFAVAPETILFYRKHRRSLSTTASALSTRQIPPSDLFDPDVFLRVAAQAMQRPDRACSSVCDGHDFLSSPECRQALQAANRIDPRVDVERCLSAPQLDIAATTSDVGQAYYRLCEAVGHTVGYTDIVFTGRNSSPQHIDAICSVLLGNAGGAPAGSTLVLADDSDDLAQWTTRLADLPTGSRVAAVHSTGDQRLTDDDVDLLCLKLLQALGPAVRVHLGGTSLGLSVWSKFGCVLRQHHAVLHRFDAQYRTIDDLVVRVDDDFALLSDMSETVRTIVAHDTAMMELDQACLGIDGDKWLVVPAPAPVDRTRSRLANFLSDRHRRVSVRRPETVGEHRPEQPEQRRRGG